MAIKDDEFNKLISRKKISTARPVIGAKKSSPIDPYNEDSVSNALASQFKPDTNEPEKSNQSSAYSVSIPLAGDEHEGKSILNLAGDTVSKALAGDEHEGKSILNLAGDTVSKALAEDSELADSVSIASSKPLAEREHTVSKALAEDSEPADSVSIASSKPLAEREHTVSRTFVENEVIGLVGKERNLLFFIFSKCEQIGALETSILTTEEITKSLDVTPVRLRNLIFRLQDTKQIIKVSKVKNGRSGWRKFLISREVYKLLKNESDNAIALAKREHTVSIASSKALANAPSKLVSDLNNNLLTSEPTSLVDNSSFLELEPVVKFGISKKHLQDIRNQKLNLSTLDLQDLITRFGIYASDANNIRGVRNLPALFMKMAQQLAQGENMLEGIETPEDQALAKILKDRAAQKARKQETEDVLLTFEFEAWLESVPAEKRNELVPESAVVRAGSHAQTVMLKKYYVENFWDTRRKELLTQAQSLSLTL